MTSTAYLLNRAQPPCMGLGDHAHQVPPHHPRLQGRNVGSRSVDPLTPASSPTISRAGANAAWHDRNVEALVLGLDLGQWFKDYGNVAATLLLAGITVAYVLLVHQQSKEVVQSRLDLRGPAVVCYAVPTLNHGSGASTLTVQLRVDNFSPAPVLVTVVSTPRWRLQHHGDPHEKVLVAGRPGEPRSETFNLVLELPEPVPDLYPFTVRFAVASIPQESRTTTSGAAWCLGVGPRSSVTRTSDQWSDAIRPSIEPEASGSGTPDGSATADSHSRAGACER